MISYELKTSEGVQQQDPSSLSYVGGYPTLPSHLDLPSCQFCLSPLTFFFQTEFKGIESWSDYLMAFFHCTKCFKAGFSVPKAFYKKDIAIPDMHLLDYQKNFRIILFSKRENLVIRNDYKRIISYQSIEFVKTKNRNKKTRIGGIPYWRIQDETPSSYMGSSFEFLMQIDDDWEFPSLAGSPKQQTIIGPSSDSNYYIFSGLPFYMFGCFVEGEPFIYMFNQK